MYEVLSDGAGTLLISEKHEGIQLLVIVFPVFDMNEDFVPMIYQVDFVDFVKYFLYFAKWEMERNRKELIKTNFLKFPATAIWSGEIL